MNTPSTLKSAANCLIGTGFFYVALVYVVLVNSDHAPDTFGKVFGGSILGLGFALWVAAFCLYRCSKVGKYLWWVCSPLVLLQFPIGTALGIFTYVYLNKPESKAALEGRVPPASPTN